MKKDRTASQAVETVHTAQECCDPINPKLEPIPFIPTPQACLQRRPAEVADLVALPPKLATCSVTELPEGCTKTVKIFDLSMTELFSGTYAEANVFCATLEDGNYFATEYIACADDQTESEDVCFSITDGVIGCGQCCEYIPPPVPNPLSTAGVFETICNECIAIDFTPLYLANGSGGTSVSVNITELPNHGTLEVTGNPLIYQYCPAEGIDTQVLFKFTITDDNDKTTNESTGIVNIEACPPVDDCINPDPNFSVAAEYIDEIDEVPLSPPKLKVTIINTTNWNGGCPDYTEYIIHVLDEEDNIVYTFPVPPTPGNNDATPTVLFVNWNEAFYKVNTTMNVANKACSSDLECEEQSADVVDTLITDIPPPANEPPVAENDSYNTAFETPLVIADPAEGVLANDYDPDGGPDPLIVLGPGVYPTTQGGSISISLNGTLTYTPPAGYSGPDTYSYQNTDGQDNSNVAVITFIVGPDPEEPAPDIVFNDPTVDLCSQGSLAGKIIYDLNLNPSGADFNNILGVFQIGVETPTGAPNSSLSYNYNPLKPQSSSFSLLAGMKAPIQANAPGNTITFVVEYTDLANNHYFAVFSCPMPPLQFADDCIFTNALIYSELEF